MPSPLAAVENAIAEGAVSRSDIARRAGIHPMTVDAVLEHLLRTGRIRRETLHSSCSSGACSSCALSDGTCTTTGARGPVMLVLQRKADNL
ncbi:hypothetical protein GSS88_05995 [Corynebacterium sp. 3HC-13]|uniref:FeoC-like transcriptional regulator n=1 Tax=Corynebacterium poyangense TaxID=2684405 RepID=UPI001CCBBB4A|nr:FeoC-like transcriptional regulator [Corynebacterium poyangense]MBZ8177349.1 hypothetical protein [Corynebacterium poyangense]